MAESSVHMGENYVHQAYTELNPLTGLYYNKAFFEYADQYLQRVAPNSYCMVAVDIEHFHFFNKLFGREEGDKLLVYIADCVRKIQENRNRKVSIFETERRFL